MEFQFLRKSNRRASERFRTENRNLHFPRAAHAQHQNYYIQNVHQRMRKRFRVQKQKSNFPTLCACANSKIVDVRTPS